MSFANLCRPRTAAAGIVALVLLVGAFENPERDRVILRLDAPLVATLSGGRPVHNSAACEAVAHLPRESVRAVYNVSAWSSGGWPYWKAVCLYKLPTKPPSTRASS